MKREHKIKTFLFADDGSTEIPVIIEYSVWIEGGTEPDEEKVIDCAEVDSIQYVDPKGMKYDSTLEHIEHDVEYVVVEDIMRKHSDAIISKKFKCFHSMAINTFLRNGN
jgi:hypothetical protein